MAHKPNSLLFNLGAFVGHVARGFRTPVKPTKQLVRKDVQEHRLQTPAGQVTLRRTTIDEIERPPPAQSAH
ncbi:MAG: hypothetical protein JNM80_08735 [Phycisphaerae bacterium]|nr:hypothetical protein [Phycisphaerae bacterium]